MKVRFYHQGLSLFSVLIDEHYLLADLIVTIVFLSVKRNKGVFNEYCSENWKSGANCSVFKITFSIYMIYYFYINDRISKYHFLSFLAL